MAKMVSSPSAVKNGLLEGVVKIGGFVNEHIQARVAQLELGGKLAHGGLRSHVHQHQLDFIAGPCLAHLLQSLGAALG